MAFAPLHPLLELCGRWQRWVLAQAIELSVHLFGNSLDAPPPWLPPLQAVLGAALLLAALTLGLRQLRRPRRLAALGLGMALLAAVALAPEVLGPEPLVQSLGYPALVLCRQLQLLLVDAVNLLLLLLLILLLLPPLPLQLWAGGWVGVVQCLVAAHWHREPWNVELWSFGLWRRIANSNNLY